jgi:hypothetical protein
MKAPRFFAAALVFAVALSLVAGLAQAGPQKTPPKKPEAKPQEKIFIPKEVKAIMQEGLATRQGRQDIPVTLFKNLYFPTPSVNVQAEFFFRVANESLGFAAPTAAPAAAPAPGQKPKEKQPAPPPAAEQEPAGTLVANVNVFLQFLQLNDGGEASIYKEVYIPVSLQAQSAAYDPQKVEWYSVGYILPPGKYTLAMAMTSKDLKKVGVSYLDFSLPTPDTYQSSLMTTPIFFIEKMEQMQAPETRVTIHQGMFTYSVLQFTPSIDNVLKVGEQVEVFFYVFGAKPKGADQPQPGQQPVYDVAVDYEVQKEDGSAAIKWAQQAYVSPVIDQPLPLKQTVKITDAKGENARTEQRDLAAGKYVMVIKIKDNVSGLTTEQKFPFELK